MFSSKIQTIQNKWLSCWLPLLKLVTFLKVFMNTKNEYQKYSSVNTKSILPRIPKVFFHEYLNEVAPAQRFRHSYIYIPMAKPLGGGARISLTPGSLVACRWVFAHGHRHMSRISFRYY